MKILRRALGILLVFVTIVAAAGAGWIAWYRNAAVPKADGDQTVSGLLQPVEINRDSMGVPSIRAHNEHDMLFAQGYVHAQDRLWQMELMRHVGEARLSELMGEKVIRTDRFLRVFGVPRAAAAQDATLDALSRQRLEAYAAGVNAYIAEGNPLPPEYRILGAKPAPWTTRNSLAIEKVMALDLAQYSISVNRSRAVARLGPDRAAALQPIYPSWGPTILDAPVAAPVPPLAEMFVRGGSIANASNAWVIAGSKTQSGKPILANDMHLALRVPSILYLNALHTDSAHAVGMSIPGSPYIVAGHNRAIAWGLTNAMLDDADLYIERRDPTDSTRYLTPTGSEPFVVIVDTILVKGHDPEILRYRMTRHGPVMSDLEDGIASGTDVIALRWIGQEASHTLLALPALMNAAGWSDFQNAVSMFDDPHQNVVYADTAGHIGYIMGGRIPDRGKNLPPSLPVPGWTGEWDWNGFLPFDQHPTVFDPPQGFVVTANNRQAAGALADRISDDWETPFRAARIIELITSAVKPLTAGDVHQMQLDVQDASALRYRHIAAAAARQTGNEAVATGLEKWDGRATRESTDATVYYVFVDRLRSQLVRSLYGDSTGWMGRSIVDNVLEMRSVPWPSAGFDSLSAAAMREAIPLSRGRAWGAAHTVTAEHPLGSVAALDRLLRLNIGNVPAPGSQTTVNVSHWGAATNDADGPRFRANIGPSQRHVVDMRDIDGSGGFILPGGESGIPFSKQYRDEWQRWLNGGLSVIPLNETPATRKPAHTLRLVPAR
ncbi:MAG: penicillin acylase family protein [Longimicrobiales bacterium]